MSPRSHWSDKVTKHEEAIALQFMTAGSQARLCIPTRLRRLADSLDQLEVIIEVERDSNNAENRIEVSQ